MVRNTRSRKDEDKAQRREDILDAAEHVIFEREIEKTSMDHIAKAVKLSRALLYVYFEDKDDIYRAIMTRASAELYRRFVEAYELDDNGLERSHAIGRAYYSFYLEKPDYFNVMTKGSTFLETLPETPSEKELKTLEVLMAQHNRCLEVMVQTLTEGVDDGSICRISVSDPVKTAYFLRGMLHGVLMSTRSDKKFVAEACDFTTEDLIEYYFDNACLFLAADHNRTTN